MLMLLAGLAAVLVSCGERVAPLPALGADLGETSVSGLSSGAYMAGQFHFAHSATVIGAGIVAGGPYGCAESVFGHMNPVWPVALAQNLNRAINGCTGTSMAILGVPNVGRLAERVRERAESSQIDPLEGLKGDRVYLFAGRSDHTVAPALVRSAAELYERVGVAKANIVLVEGIDAGHGFITKENGNACGDSRTPYLNDCDYDQAGKLLGQIYGPLKLPAGDPAGKLLLFDQAEFGDEGLDGVGVAFVPDDCAVNSGCRVHVAFHGCNQGRAAVGNAFVEGAGYNRWAAANRIIILYPQVSDSGKNPQGCWDWWGYTGPKFLTREAPQIRAVKAMLDRLAG